MSDELRLVREYAARGSEAAFEGLVSRHINPVYSAALRRTGDASLAEEITQVVFILLAQKAASRVGENRKSFTAFAAAQPSILLVPE